ncbi:phage head-tail connector protein [Oceanobacillus massiliensis]|uniref:phage head-tail connector protein n=1 Tax=Oceanobacillus massiliensis TaxID=1465765 RepID=UPI003017F05A
MNTEEMLTNIKPLLDIEVTDSNKDAVLNLYISRAINFTRRYLKVTEVPEGLQDVIEDIAIFKFRQKGVENIKSEGKGSLSETYIETLPADIITQLDTEARKVRVV